MQNKDMYSNEKHFFFSCFNMKFKINMGYKCKYFLCMTFKNVLFLTTF